MIALSIDTGITYNADRAIFLGIKPMHTTYLLGLMGITNTIGKIVMGKLVDIFRSRIFLLTTFVMLAHTILFSTGDFFPSMIGQASCFAFFGLTFGAYYSTSAVLIK